MSTLRLRRLQSDYEAVKRLARLHPKVRVEGVAGNPPDRYRLELRVRSLREVDGRVVAAPVHRLEVVLPRGYPRDAPLCRMLTPVFHPNIAPHAVCIGDHWTAEESLDRMIQRVGEMLAFQSYNVKSPLNGLAARWVEEHLDRVPIDPEEFFVDLDAAPAPAEAGACANCGAPAAEACRAGHPLCGDCVARCDRCGLLLCLACGTTVCPSCPPAATHEGAAPTYACSNCGAAAREGCAAGHPLCPDCIVHCERCGALLCLSCGASSCASCA